MNHDHELGNLNLSMITDVVPVCISFVDLNYIYKYVNQQYENWFGKKKEDLLNQHIRVIVGEKGFELSKFCLDKAFKGEHFRCERFMITSQKEKKHLSIEYKPAFHPDTNKIIGACVVANDITEIKNAKLQLEQSNKELERFAYIASHDLKTPIRNISLYSGLLLKKMDEYSSEEIVDILQEIESNSHGMYDLIEAVLEVSKLNNRPLQIRKVPVLDMINNSMKKLHKMIVQKQVEVSFQELPTIDCDRILMESVIQNLIENAIKYNQSEHPRLVISSERTPNGDGYEFSFKDNGLGIEPEFHDKVFEMFRRLNNNQSTGTGIGLAVCKRAIELHNGKIWIENNKDHGSNFKFTLPIIRNWVRN